MFPFCVTDKLIKAGGFKLILTDCNEKPKPSNKTYNKCYV